MTNTERWRRVRDAFEAAVDADPNGRKALLDDLGADNPDLRDEVEAMLARHDVDGSVLERAAHEAVVAGSEAPGLESGARIGPYRLVRELGRGGMGTVYLAERADGSFRQQVAIKLIHTTPGNSIVERFHREREILAGLEHPNIARLLDGGTTDDGLPYYVMERVEGEAIDRYCDRNALSIDERLALFRKVCAAVQAAHQRLIIHRDLKPANILVNEAGEPKLLDFGIAKRVGPAAQTAGLTVAGLRPMTLRYASPEQVRGETLTTASDVYALGVLLYVLLAGREPYTLADDRLGTLECAICDQVPRPPSIAVEEGEPAARRRARRLVGDLDTVVLKALHKEPDRRYASIEQFSDDLDRYGAGLPVRARRSTVWYRASRFFRRHRIAAAVAGVVLLGAAVQQRNTLRARDRAEANATQSARERDKAERTRDFLVELFTASDPDEARGEAVTARTILDRGARRIREELRDEPDVRATLLRTLGLVYRRLGRYDTARELLSEALETRRGLTDEMDADTAASLADLAGIDYVTGAYETAVERYEEALGVFRAAGDGRSPEVASVLGSIGAVRWAMGEYDTAETFARQSLELRRALFEGDHPDVAESLDNLATVLVAKGDFTAGIALQREAVEVRRRIFGEDNSLVATTLSNLAVTLQAQGDFAAAEALYRETLAIRRARLDPSHPDLARTMNNLASVLRERGDHHTAITLYREALALRRDTLGEDHPSIAISLNNLASAVRDQGDLAGAETLFREAIALWRRQLGERHRTVAIGLTNLAAVQRQRGQVAAAERTIQQALAILDAALPADHWRAAVARGVLGACAADRGRLDLAESLLRNAHTRLLETKGPESRYTQTVAMDLEALEAARAGARRDDD